ncbi:hypothetical protein BZG36_03501 [Bifiguratus adelaidae]|uniref:DUF3020 domain-containing protein n=1 Tax=Bifiguratus adelaidae TaxID=1938954 RepID=A0A261XZ97_9FUNG|nr:hypothetical protein BZG36_03501 [Bifiguratus adelaidae]
MPSAMLQEQYSFTNQEQHDISLMEQQALAGANLLSHQQMQQQQSAGLGAQHSQRSQGAQAGVTGLSYSALPKQNMLSQLQANIHSSSSSPLSTPGVSTPGTPNLNLHNTNVSSHDSADAIKKELINQKVRAENRERKKRWREQNEDRNKDNDLRCRVNKRANKLFGKTDSEHKKKWIEEEFVKRQLKRKEKERRKQVVNGNMGGSASPSQSGMSNSQLLGGGANNLTASQINQFPTANVLNALQQPQSNNLYMPPLSPNTVNQKIFQQNLGSLLKAKGMDPSLFNFDTALLNLAAGVGTPNASTPTSTTIQTNQQSQTRSSQQSPQPQSVQNVTFNDSNAASASDTKLPTPPTDGTDSLSLLATPVDSPRDSPNPNTLDHVDSHGKQSQGNKQDYPMDAVLTLMQLNAGWRQ